MSNVSLLPKEMVCTETNSRATDLAPVEHPPRPEGKRNDIEDMCLARLKEALPDDVKATILADRGFGDAKLFGFLEELGFEYVVRFRANVFVTAADGETRHAPGIAAN